MSISSTCAAWHCFSGCDRASFSYLLSMRLRACLFFQAEGVARVDTCVVG